MTVKSTVEAASCPDAITTGRICAHAVTVDMLRGWGFDCARELPHLSEPGPAFHVALHKAWQADHVRMCTLDPRTVTRPLPWKDQDHSAANAEALAWCAAHLRGQDRK